nr:LuxR C-terminal-related transcriptional regulator [uncultured Actinoplanes sp.]
MVVETKFFPPATRAGTLARARLTERLSHAGGRLTLVSAPAGFGKTTLLGRWLASMSTADTAVAWVSLDEQDRQPAAFWTYVITALDRAVPGAGAEASAMLQAGRAPVENVLAAVINELSVLPGDLVLVLDDYHLADGPDIRPGMRLLVDRLPPQVRLVISTRADPDLPLARLRARGELTEVRAGDLRFTTGEAGAYLASAGLTLRDADVAALAERTEGWAAALQLAALSLRGRDDVSGFIEGFAGTDRFVVDYLVEEVLDRQPPRVRRFLVETSVLDRLTGSLCDAVTAGAGGKAMLEALDRANLFLVPLDDRRLWYRYHHLFRDVLLDSLSGDAAELHRRAGEWYDRAGEPVPAVRHLLAAGEAERAADVVERAIPELRRTRQEATLRRWVDELPAEVVARRPVVAVGFVGALMASNEFGDVERRLADIVRAQDADRTVIDAREAARLPAAVEMYRAGLALINGDPAGTLRHTRRVSELAAADDHLIRSSVSALAGLACWTTGDLTSAHRHYSAAADGLRRVGHLSDVLGCSITIADLELTQGRLRRAQRTYEQAMRLGPGLRGIADMHVGLSQIALEHDDLAAAADHLRRGEALGERAGLPQYPYRWRVAMALLREAEGDRDTAITLLTEAERVYVGDFSPDVRPVSALRARMLAAQGDLPAALDWADRRGLRPDDDVPYVREYEYLTLARVLLAGNAVPKAVALLERLLAAAEGGGRTGTVIEILVVLSLARRAAGDSRATPTLERAVTLGRPEGYARIFGGTPRPERPARPERLADPLSDRELDVMRLLAGDLDGPSIARHVVVSLNTVRTHTKHIYAKLGVTNRRAAVRRAHQLNLLVRAGNHHTW